MKRFITLSLLFCLVSNRLFAQKNRKNQIQSFITLETGLSFSADPTPNFSTPFNIEFQRIKKKWGFGAALGLDFDKYSEGDCNRRLEVSSYVSFFAGSSVSSNSGFYCKNDKYFTFKPSLFGSYYFLQNKKINFFTKIGLTTNVLNINL